MLMHTSVKVNPDTKSLKAADGKTAGDRWVNVLSRYIYRDKRGRYVYFLCANAIRKLANPVEVATKSSAATLTPKPKPKTVNISVPATTVQINTAPSTTTKEVVDTVIIKRRVHVVYQDEYVYDQPPELMINVPANQYRYSESPQGPIGGQGCVCYHDPKDPKGLVYRYRYPNGQLFCVPKEMGDNTIYPPGYGPN